MASNFGINALVWPWPSPHVDANRDTRALMEVELVRAMREHPDTVAQANAVYNVTINPAGSWTVDATVPGGRVSIGVADHADCIFVTDEETLNAIIDRRLSPEWAYVTGRLRVSDLGQARRLAAIIQEVLH